MSSSLTRIKRFHSPARKMQIEESPSRSTITLTELRTRKLKKSLHPKNLNIPTSQAQMKPVIYPFFKPISFKEVFLVEPSENRRVLGMTKSPLKENLKLKRIDTSERARSYLSHISENSWKKLEIHQSQKSERSEQAARYFKLIKNCQELELKQALSKYPELVNSVDALGMNGLHWAAIRNNTSMGKLLISYKIKFHQQDCLGRTALTIARKYKSSEFLLAFSHMLERKESFLRSSKN